MNIQKRIEQLEEKLSVTHKKPTPSQQAKIVMGDCLMEYCELYKIKEEVEGDVLTSTIEYAKTWRKKLREPMPNMSISKTTYKQEQKAQKKTSLDISFAQLAEAQKRVEQQKRLERQSKRIW